MKTSCKLFLVAALVVLAISFNASAQENIWSANYESPDSFTKDKAAERPTFPKEFKLFNLNLEPLRQQLISITDSKTHQSTVISLPNANGEMERYEIFEASNFDPKLQSQFPEIRAFSGKGLTDKYAVLKLSVSPQGIQTMVFRNENVIEFIEPFSDNHAVYAVFISEHRQKGELPWTCSTEDRSMIADINTQIPASFLPESSAGQVKTMRLAQSVTAEYSNFFGATSSTQLALVLTAINNTMTRCNGVYEKDLAVHLNLIPNESAIIYYDPNTDPYSPAASGAGGAWNGELQANLTSTIGAANYDIGHLFGATGGGGNAGCIGCVCVDGSKGSGFTSPADGIPMGDNFDIDYVVHEVGHQMGANHTFSHSLEGSGRNKEVGAGITIMGYAGITSFDPAPHSIDIFHETSIEQIQNNLANKTCPVTTVMTVNHAPVVTPVGPYTIPISTAFALTGVATDQDGDALTYNWEQNDNATTSGANSVASPTKATGPNWLSFPSTASPTRLFPRLSTILAGLFVTPPFPGGDAGTNIEALSSVARTLNFRVTVRDNNPYVPGVKVGQTQFADTAVTVSSAAGPFKVTAPNTSGITFPAGSTQTITWDVANTTAAPVSVANVKISISFDGGQTFPTVLAASTANDGSEVVTIPNTGTTQGRIKIEAIGNIFFDINDASFSISGAATPTTTPTNTFTPTPSPTSTNTGTPSPTPTNTNTSTPTTTPTAGPTPCNLLTFSYTGPAVPITDNVPAGTNFTIPVSGAGTISDLNFRFDGTQSPDPASTTPGVNHSWVGDLIVKITSPAGTTVSAYDRPGVPATTFGCSSNNLAQIVLDDDGGFPQLETQCGADTNAAFPTGSFSPNSALSAFDGQNPNGNWTINISDNAGGDTGSARAFSIILGSACASGSPTSTATATSTFTGTPVATATNTATPSCTPAWQAGAVQAPARYAIQGVLGTDNKLYVAGGQSIDATPILSNKLTRFNPVTNAWEDLAALPVALGQGAMGASGGKVYVAGGFTGGTTVTNALRIYDIATNAWTSGANMPTAVEAAAGTVVGGKFYVMGGDDFNNGVTTNQIYDIATNTWTTGAVLPDARTNTYGTVAGGLIYVYGGVTISGTTFTAVDTLLRYTPATNSWTNLGSAGTVGARGNYGAVSPYGTGQLLITDGADSNGNSTTTTHFFTISSGTFSAGPAMTTARAGHAQGTLADGRVLVADGFNATTATTTVELLTGCAIGTPTNTATNTPTATGSPTATASTSTPTSTATATGSPACTPSVLYDNGPIVTNPTGGAGGAPLSALQTGLGLNILGFGATIVAPGNSLADDFVVPAGGWTINNVTLYGYQTGSTTTSTFNTARVQIWNGVPGAAGSTVVFGDLTTNRFASSSWSGAYRATDTAPTGNTRPIMATIANVGTTLAAGTYWLEFQLGGTGASGPFVPPVSILGSVNKPGSNALQGSPAGTTFTAVIDTGTANAPQDIPFILNGQGSCGTPTATATASPSSTSTSTATATPTGSPVATCTPSNFSNTAAITILDNLPANPYPSNVTVAGLTGNVTKVTVDLTGLTHTFPDDIDIMLVGPNGQNTLLMSDAGGSLDVTNVNLTFDDAAATGLGDSTQIVSGTFKPTDFDTTSDVFPAPAPAVGATVALSVFNGTTPNGTWSLYVRDDVGVDTGSISGGWALHITTSSCGTPLPTATSTSTPTATATNTPSGGTSVQFSSTTYIDDESQTAAITINRTGSLAGTNSVSFSTANGTAVGGASCTSGVDYVSVSNQTVTFNPNDTTKTVNVTLCSDLLNEPTETINLALTGANVGSPSAAVLSINDTASVYRAAGAICTTFGQPASPYPSTISVAGGPASVGSIRVTLFDVTHTIPDSMDFLLVGPGGQKFILMADAGGTLDLTTPVTLTFSDVAGQVLPNSAPLTTGLFEPTSWEPGQASFAPPAPPAPYNEPGSAVGGTGTQTLNGNFGGTNGNGTWSLYMRDDAGSFNAPAAITGCVNGGWGLELFGGTAANASISGRVMTANGAGIRNAKVTVTGNSLVEPRVVTTGSFGYFTIEGLAVGETYVVTVNSQRYIFSTPSRVISLVDNIADLDFIANPAE